MGATDIKNTKTSSNSSVSSVPSKFSKGKRSFVDRIAHGAGDVGVSSFGAFPKDVTFSGKEDDEDVVLIVRRSFAAFIPQYALILALLLSPVGLFILLGALDFTSGSAVAIGIGGAITLFLIAVTVAFDTFLKWYFSVNIITDQRIIDVDFVNVMYHRFSETQLEKIEDVTHEVTGILGSLFDFGSVYLQTAASVPEFQFENIPRPRDVQDTLLDLLEMKQKGTI